MKKLAVLGPNPAWQKTLFFPDFNKGAVNRARKMEELPSGKGINFCRVRFSCFCARNGRFRQISQVPLSIRTFFAKPLAFSLRLWYNT